MIKATHSGKLTLGEGEPVECHVLEDGTCVLVASQIQGFLGASKNRHFRRTLATFGSGSDSLDVRPRTFAGPGGPSLGYTTEDVLTILRAFVRALRAGTLHHKQIAMAMSAMAALDAFADVGLRTLVHDATGYASVRPVGDQQEYFNRVFAEKMRAWELMFDAEWDELLCSVYGKTYDGRPPRFAAQVNARIYQFGLGVAAHDELVSRNPNPSHHSNHHQHLTDAAREAMSQTIAMAKGVARLCPRNPRKFIANLETIYNNAPLQLDLIA